MKNLKVDIDLNRLREVLDSDAEKKKAAAAAIGGVRQTISKILNGTRYLYAGEMLAIADIYEIDPRELGLRE